MPILLSEGESKLQYIGIYEQPGIDRQISLQESDCKCKGKEIKVAVRFRKVEMVKMVF